MRFGTSLGLVGLLLLLLLPQAGWCFTEEQTITVDMGWFQLRKLDMSQFNLLEAQLGGVKLGDTIYNYLGHRDGHARWTSVAKYYGNPTGLVVGGAAAQPPTSAAPPVPMPAGAAAGPGAYPGVTPYGGGAGMAAPGAVSGLGSAMGTASAMARGAVAAGGYQLPPVMPFPSAAALAFQPPMGMVAPGAAPSPFGGPMAAPGMGMPGAFPSPTAPTAAAPAAALAEARGPEGLLANDEEPVPYWALPVWFALQPDEVEYVYHKTPNLVIGIVVNEDGVITAVAVAGAPTHFAKTSLGRAHRYVQLGDLFKMILYRYGYPDKVQTFNSETTDGRVVEFRETVNQFDNDCILWFDEETESGLRKNIAFTCHNMKVTRIHIWIPQEEE